MESQKTWPPGTNLGMPSKKSHTMSISNFAMLLMCVTSIVISCILAYRELRLEARIANLESRCQNVETNMDLKVTAIRRNIEEIIAQEQRTAAANQQRDSSQFFRNKRDISECNCPPGEFSNTQLIVHFFTVITTITLRITVALHRANLDTESLISIKSRLKLPAKLSIRYNL